MAARKFTIDHEYLKQLAKQLGRPFSTLYVLSWQLMIRSLPTRRSRRAGRRMAGRTSGTGSTVASGAHVYAELFYLHGFTEAADYQMPNGRAVS